MRRMIAAAALAASVLGGAASPVVAQSRADEVRWDQAQARYDSETQRYYAERDRYYSMRGRGGYAPPPPPPDIDDGPSDRYENGYDPARYYRPGTSDRVLARDDRVYAGNDGRYYCRRSDGTTGLIVGAAGGGVLGNVIDGGHSRAAGTLIGAAIGALAGRAVDQNQSQIRCR